ncbi:CsbD family protein [Caulobacter sp. X]|nr:CsbD family protein [Caulobacter sp. X]
MAACDKEAGRKQETVGKIESGAGKIVGDKDLKSEGKKDQVAGNVKQGELKDAVKEAKK